MIRPESSVILTCQKTELDLSHSYRLIHTVDAFRGYDVFSVFLSTKSNNCCDEEFVYDISHDEATAKEIFSLLYQGSVSACTLQDILRDMLTEL